MSDLNSQLFNPTQPEGQTLPLTVAAANVISPVGFLTILTGNVVVKTIVPKLLGVHMIAIKFNGVAGVDATGNVATAKASVDGEIMLLVFNPIDNQYYPVG